MKRDYHVILTLAWESENGSTKMATLDHVISDDPFNVTNQKIYLAAIDQFYQAEIIPRNAGYNVIFYQCVPDDTEWVGST